MSKLTASRVALIAAFLTSLAAGIAGAAKAIPGSLGSTILTIAGMLGAVGTSITFALGTMKWDATPVGQAVHADRLGVTLPPGVARVEPVQQQGMVLVPPPPAA